MYWGVDRGEGTDGGFGEASSSLWEKQQGGGLI